MATLIPAGTDHPYTITYLEMLARPGYDRPSLPLGPPTALIRAEAPPVWYFLALYSAVGAAYEWVDQLSAPEDKLRAWLHAPGMEFYTLSRQGWPAGFFLLEDLGQGRTDLAYFGLVPEAIGQGLGAYLLRTAIHAAWDRPGTERLTVNTCTLDHPGALGLYQRCGFVPYGQERKSRVLTRDRFEP